MRLSALPLSLCLLATPAWSAPDGVTVYRCTDGQGRLTLRDTPCRKGESQQRREMLRPRDPPPRPVVRASAPTRLRAPPTTTTRVIFVAPPKPLFECVTPDGERYTSETDQGQPRYVPLWTLGYPAEAYGRDGRPVYPDDGIGRPPPRGMPGRDGRPGYVPVIGVGPAAYTWVRDVCSALPQGEVCARLRDRREDLDRRYNSALQSERGAITSEQRGIDARLDTDC